MGAYVWSQLGEASSEDARAVAQETMRRARKNVEMIVAYLREQRYEFVQDPWVRPSAESARAIEQLEDSYGPLPLSLRTWWEVVGAVSLQGYFRGAGGLPMADPLMVVSPEEALAWLRTCEADGEPLTIEIAPDIYIKADVSGGPAYKIRLPAPGADAPLAEVRIFIPAPPGSAVEYEGILVSETFVEYLRRSFRWAGFPGCAFGEPEHLERIEPLLGRMTAL